MYDSLTRQAFRTLRRSRVLPMRCWIRRNVGVGHFAVLEFFILCVGVLDLGNTCVSDDVNFRVGGVLGDFGCKISWAKTGRAWRFYGSSYKSTDSKYGISRRRALFFGCLSVTGSPCLAVSLPDSFLIPPRVSVFLCC